MPSCPPSISPLRHKCIVVSKRVLNPAKFNVFRWNLLRNLSFRINLALAKFHWNGNFAPGAFRMKRKFGNLNWSLLTKDSLQKRVSFCRPLLLKALATQVSFPTRLSLFCYLVFSDDHPDNREMGYSNVLQWKGHSFQKIYNIIWSTNALWWSRDAEWKSDWPTNQPTNCPALGPGVGAYANENTCLFGHLGSVQTEIGSPFFGHFVTHIFCRNLNCNFDSILPK